VTEANKYRHAYRLLTGERLSLGGLEDAELAYLQGLRARTDAGEDYFDLLREVRGQGSPALASFGGRVTIGAAQSLFFRVALDIVERAGVRQGRVLDTSDCRPESPTRFVSIADAAGKIGLSRQAVHRAIQKGKIVARFERRLGYGASTWVVDLESAIRYGRDKGST